MTNDKKTKNILSILPGSQIGANVYSSASRALDAATEADNIQRKKTSRELADMKWKEKQKLKTIEKNEHVPKGRTRHSHEKIEEQKAEQQAKIEVIEAIEEQYESTIPRLVADGLPHSSNTKELLRMQGTSRAEVLKLMSSLNINLNVQLTRQDTANMLACLLTCNEQQLKALYNNKKIPIVIKTVIRRLLEDSNLGNIETIEKLWDRIFGKAAMSLNLPEQAQVAGILPNTPVSREAYLIIRETLIGQ